jgi:four helix bundle protein
MAAFHSFEDIDAWQESRRLVRTIRSICRRPQVIHDRNFVDQISAAARSISANIAEGCEASTTKGFIQFLGYAKRSAGEVRSHLHDALDEGYVNATEFEELVSQCLKISRMLASLIRYLRNLANSRPIR